MLETLEIMRLAVRAHRVAIREASLLCGDHCLFNVFIKRSAINGGEQPGGRGPLGQWECDSVHLLAVSSRIHSDSSLPELSAASAGPDSTTNQEPPLVRFIDLANAVDLPAPTPDAPDHHPGAFVPTKASQQQAEQQEPATYTAYHGAPEQSYLLFCRSSGEAEALIDSSRDARNAGHEAKAEEMIDEACRAK
ncbi:unnamed protein product [Vitrella brassicaformis CCMP3155]|uniref:Uncharacterized protein n=1 Tax=Vitrella brassicaformis (strain CCMP3155) TaxID=1169540 RepID=A0A0G4ELR0_VITBC|nr:unnamed protein product [Vitrella brassicaformis CCMP3155]|eukprot:CEL98051.1 unnamed protein product [Vitrella brassicaformis CCMP3155]